MANETEQGPQSAAADASPIEVHTTNNYIPPSARRDTPIPQVVLDIVVGRFRDRSGAAAVWPDELDPNRYHYRCAFHRECEGTLWESHGKPRVKCAKGPDEETDTEQFTTWVLSDSFASSPLRRLEVALESPNPANAVLALLDDDAFVDGLNELPAATLDVVRKKIRVVGITRASLDQAMARRLPPPIDDETDALRQAEEQLAFDRKAFENDERPEIKITTEEDMIADQAIAALVVDKTIFQQHGLGLIRVNRDDGLELKRTKHGRARGAPTIELLPKATLRERMAATALWSKYSMTRSQWEPAHPPEWATEAILARGSWQGIRRLEGVVECPVLRDDGTIIEKPGYDDQTGLLYEPAGPVFPIKDAPTLADAQQAISDLCEVVCDFPFAGPDHCAAWLAALITPVACAGAWWSWNSPLFLFDANTRGSGKTLMADLISIILSGRDMSRMTLPDQDDEARKVLLSIAMKGDTLVFFDEAKTIQGSALNAVLTGRNLSGRVLGETRMVDATFRGTCYAAGNNVPVKGDSARRVIHSRLESREEHPEDRQMFRHPNVKAWTRRERPRLVAAVMTLLKAFHVAGRPAQRPPIGSFESWSRAVRDPLTWAGCADPCDTRKALLQNDPDETQLRQLIAGWGEVADREAITVHTACDRLSRSPTLKSLFDDWGGLVGDKPKAIVLSKRISKHKERWCGGRRIAKGNDSRDGVVTWRVETAEDAEVRKTQPPHQPPQLFLNGSGSLS